MGFMLLLEIVALAAMVWLLFRIDSKLQSIGDMISDASKSEDRPASKFAPIIKIRYTVLILWFRSRPPKGRDPCNFDTRSSAWPSSCHA